jgi:hypothetical protein
MAGNEPPNKRMSCAGPLGEEQDVWRFLHPLAVWLALTMMAHSPGCAESSEDDGQVFADDIPVANTPDCGWVEWPDPVLTTCTEPLLSEAADLRGIWEGYEGDIVGHVERIEQCGNRVVIMGGGVTHDMRADGTLENGVNDIAAATCADIAVSAEFVDGVLELRPFGGDVLVTREIDGDDLLWVYAGFTTRLRRLEELPE